ncbi:MAG: type 1 glutamine amidotransferase domain-containing protein [Geminicoccaceae bacterium]
MRILVVLTSHDRLGDTGRRTGFWLEELAAPYYVFRDAGVALTLASPKGGQPPLDPKSDAPEAQTDATRRFNGDPEAREALAHTVPLADVDPDAFDAVFFPGGHGPLWDLTNDRHALGLIEGRLAASWPVALVCHAPGILTRAKAPDGGPLARGRRVTGFTDAEEEAVQLIDVVPYLLEDVLKAQGARFEAADPWSEHVVRDGLLVTGQNPASSARAAQVLLEALRERRAA